MMERRKTFAATARAAVTAGLALSMAIGVIAPTAALAAPESGTVTITASQGNAVTYDARQIFKADILATGKAQHIEWASDAAKAAVEGAIRAEDADYAGTTAQDALEFINAHWGESSTARIVNAGDFANKLADACDGLAGAETITPGTAKSLEEGFWLIVTTPSTLDADNEHGTSPIFTAVNKDAPVSITEKTSLPSVAKEVKEDSTGTWGNHADAERGQDIDYKLTGTVASNVATFDTYFYEFEDTLSDGLDMDTSSVAVTVDGVDVTAQLAAGSITFTGGKLKVTIEDLKAFTDAESEPIPITASTNVIVTYKAHLDADAAIGAAGNPNEVFINYSNNPNTDSKGHTNTVQAKAYAYQLEMVKVDKDKPATKLQGAKVTIQVAAGNSDAASAGKYVQADGTLGDTAYEFTTNADGVISVAGLDEGTYTLHETTPPAGYAAWDADITLSITSQFNAATGAFETIAATMAGGEGDTNTKVTAVDSATGKVSIQATDDKELETPLTGAGGIALITTTGVGIIGLSLAGLWKASKKDEAQSQQ